jgi:agmatinase
MTKFYNLSRDVLVPAGGGVFTVNTAKEYKEKVRTTIYGKQDPIQAWEKQLRELELTNDPCLLGVCSDNGGGIQRGANWGPLFIRDEIYRLGPIEHLIDLGDIRVIPHLLHDKYLNDETIKNCQQALYPDSDQNHPVSPLSLTEYYLDEFYQKFPKRAVMSLGGDHSVSYPLVKSYLKSKNAQGIKTAIIHFDAHTDLLVTRLGIDLCFGSWCTHILDGLDSPDLLIQLGIRSSGKPKEHWEKTFGVKQYWASELTTDKTFAICDAIKKQLHDQKVEELYISFDIDALDANIAGATGTPEPDGMTTDQCALIIEPLLKDFPLSGADMVEVAPFVNHGPRPGKINPEPDSTLLAAGSLTSLMINHLTRYSRAGS